MPNQDGTGPRGGGRKDGSGNGTRDNQSNNGSGPKTGGQKGGC